MTRSASNALGANSRIRTRKLNTRTNLSILRQEDLQELDDEAQRNVPTVESGVERAEEKVGIPFHRSLRPSPVFVFLPPVATEFRLSFCRSVINKPRDLTPNNRNTTCRPHSQHHKQLPLEVKSLKYTSRLQMRCRVRSTMTDCILLSISSLSRISGFLPP